MFPFGCRSSLPPRLPRPVPPFHGETTASYVYRLAVVNQVHPDDLRAHLAGTRQPGPVTLGALSAATGRSPRCLGHALPELAPDAVPGASPSRPAYHRRTVCWRCAARRDAFPFATVWQPAEASICPAHLTWLRQPSQASRHLQHDVGHLTEILRAQRRHYRLARCHGRVAAAAAFEAAAHITALWARHAFYPGRRAPLIDALAARPPLTGRLQPGDFLIPVVTYPETVDLARVLATWRHPGAAGDGIRLFRRDVDHHVGIRYHPEDSQLDPLFRWFQKHAT
jgi:hypothetical protein